MFVNQPTFKTHFFHERNLAAEKLRQEIENQRIKREKERLAKIRAQELAEKRKRMMIKLKQQQILKNMQQFTQSVKTERIALEKFHQVSRSHGFSYYK